MKKKLIATDENVMAFKEEKENLKNVQQKISSFIESEQYKLEKLQQDINGLYVAVNEDREDKLELIEHKDKMVYYINKYKSFISTPYFGRFDVSCNDGETETFFIGKESLGKGSEIIILDWRSPLGNTFYNKREHKFVVNGNDYELFLRRAIDIKNSKLVSVKTEYDAINLSLEGEVIDPFLISVLKDKRRNYKLTDIIQTIQENQNKIIRKPLNESFIVQGCAGSGKTMILLHRLSYIAFNNPNINFGKFCVLTPNEYFNIHVDELSKALGLDKIKRYTVEAFYFELIQSLSKPSEKSKTIDKTNSSLKSERILNKKMLSFIYSNEFYYSFIIEYKNRSNEAIHSLNDNMTIDILRKFKNIPDIKEIDFSSYQIIYSSLKDTIDKQAAYRRSMDIFNELLTKHNNAQNELEKRKNVLTKERENLIQTIVKHITELIDKDTKNLDEIVNYRKKVDIINNDKLNASKQVKSTEDLLGFSKTTISHEFLTTSNEEVAILIRNECSDEISYLEELQKKNDSIAFYNFGKRNRIRLEIEAALERLLNRANDVVKEIADNKTNELDALRIKIAMLDDLINMEINKIVELLRENKVYSSLISTFKLCEKIISTDEYPNLNMKLSPSDKEILSEYTNAYNQAFQQYSESKVSAEACEAELNRNLEDIQKIKNSEILSEDIDALTQALNIIEQFNPTNMLKHLDNKMASIYKRFDQTYSNNVKYKHMLFVKLLLYMLYYGSANNIGYYINVDEAQDLSPSEYMLLKRILGNKTVFNLYGDVNQSIYEYKGISDWDEISEIITKNVYFLNENYRNTIEITNYCNKEFSAEVIAVGLSGNKVKCENLNDALTIIKEIHANNPEIRTAIIYKQGLSELREEIEKKLKNNAAFDIIEQKSISVITVEEAKGLEFDAVLVIKNDMTVNEQYISFTRALDNLIVSKLEQPLLVLSDVEQISGETRLEQLESLHIDEVVSNSTIMEGNSKSYN